MQDLVCNYLKTLSCTHGDNPRTTILVETEGQDVTLNLWSPWENLVDFLTPYSKLRVYKVNKVVTDDSFYFSTGSDSIVIVDPDVLINTTNINSVSFCPRSYYINQIIGDIASPYIAVRGTVIHNCLGAAVALNSKPSTELSQVLDSMTIQYERFGYTKDDVYQDVHKMAEALDSFIDSISSQSLPEILFLSPMFGVRGRIDILDDKHIYELKTAKISKNDDIRFSDLTQVVVYAFGVSNSTDLQEIGQGSVIYVGKNEVVQKSADSSWGILRFAMRMRNIAYGISYHGYVPPILSESQQKRCHKCSVKHFCAMLCAGLEQQRDCSSCPHNLFCTKNALSKNYQQYFSKYSNLLRLEKTEWARNQANLWMLSPDQRVAKGKAISNLVLENEITEDGITRLLFSCKNDSELREGDIVVMSQGNVLENTISTCIISGISNNSVEIEVRGNLPQVTFIDIYSIDVGFRRQQRGLFNHVFKRNNFSCYVIDNEKPEITPIKGDYIKNNPVQNGAIEKILGTKGYCLIQGPAGTGKTHVIAKTAILLANKGEKILLTAFTNRAVDNVCKYLVNNRYYSFVRLGSSHSIQQEIREYTLQKYREKNPDKTSRELLQQIPIIVATTATISNPSFEQLGIQTIIIDEASQMTEPTLLSAIMEGDRMILVGDHKQLPPVVQNPKSQKGGLSLSLFERLGQISSKTIHLLTHQFRMNEKIVEFSNETFYDGKLKSFDNLVKLQNLLDLGSFTGDYENLENPQIYSPKTPLVFIPITGVYQPNRKVNLQEAKIVGKITNHFLQMGISIDQIGVIAPYRGQVGEIRRYLPPNVTVDTVDRFQGSDREIIILSLTELIPRRSKGFGDYRRLNVSITRAKKKLVVVGNPSINEKILGEYVDYLKEKSAVVKIGFVEDKVEKETVQEIIVVAENISKTARILKKVIVKSKKITEAKGDRNKCLICFQPIYENAIECPFCERLFHIDHLVAWIEESERCPYCKTKLILHKIPRINRI